MYSLRKVFFLLTQAKRRGRRAGTETLKTVRC